MLVSMLLGVTLAGPILGLATTFQAVPSQCSIKLRGAVGVMPETGLPIATSTVPTAHTLLLAMAVTPSNFACTPGSGTVTNDQLVPSKCSAIGLLILPLER